MCLIVFALDAHPDYALVLAANRDEFYDRPTAPAHFWDQEGQPGLLAGRDEQAGGTWMGLTRDGRFAALTNVRAPGEQHDDAPSRGALVTRFLVDERAPEQALAALATRSQRYNGFNLLAGAFSGAPPSGAPGTEAAPRLWHVTNQREGRPQRVAPGVHGLSNATLDTDWPKTERATRALRRLLAAGDGPTPEGLLDLLGDRTPAPEAALPDTGVSPALERALSPVFIQTDGYGTRSSTALLVEHSGAVTLVERSFTEGVAPVDRRFSFDIEANRTVS